ncbi:hypothetical protein D7X33_15555 [Butyricicoccus sp. 1XD8-22]|nr:hypothetical protein D7X33_15555 [Butyricicoccus sp. 1XD8-22]
MWKVCSRARRGRIFQTAAKRREKSRGPRVAFFTLRRSAVYRALRDAWSGGRTGVRAKPASTESNLPYSPIHSKSADFE